jgi:hypothetical protein
LGVIRKFTLHRNIDETQPIWNVEFATLKLQILSRCAKREAIRASVCINSGRNT